MTEDDPYARRWKEARRGYYLFYGTWLAFPVVATVVRELAQGLTPGSGALLTAFFPVYALCWGYTAFRAGRWRCPRCEQPFTRMTLWRNDFATRCLHCGLPRGISLAQAEAGAFEPLRFTWRRALRGVLAGLEILAGIMLLCANVSRSPRSRVEWLLAAAGSFGFLLPGALLATQVRGRWWFQLLVPAALVVLACVRAHLR